MENHSSGQTYSLKCVLEKIKILVPLLSEEILKNKKDTSKKIFYKKCRENNISYFEARDLVSIVEEVLYSNNYRQLHAELLDPSKKRKVHENLELFINNKVLSCCNNLKSPKEITSALGISRAYLYKILKTKTAELSKFTEENELNKDSFLYKYINSVKKTTEDSNLDSTVNNTVTLEPTFASDIKPKDTGPINLTPLADQIRYGWVKYDPIKKVYVKTDKYPEQVTT